MCSSPQLTSDPIVLMNKSNLLLFHKISAFDLLNPDELQFDLVALGNTFRPLVSNPEKMKLLGGNDKYVVPQNTSW